MALGAWFMARSISELKCWVSCHSLVHASYIAFRIWHPVLMCALDFWLHAVSICCAGATNVNDIDWTTRKNTAFADHLLKTLGKGAESCQGIQEAAQCVVEESNGNCSELTKRFARIGTSGTNPQNCERDLFRLINLLVESWLYVFSFYIYIYMCVYYSKEIWFINLAYHCPRIQFLSPSLWKTRSRRIVSDIYGAQSSCFMRLCIMWHPLINFMLILKNFKNSGGFGLCTSHITQLQLKASIGHWDWRWWCKVQLGWQQSYHYLHEPFCLTASVAVNHTGEKLLWWLIVA